MPRNITTALNDGAAGFGTSPITLNGTSYIVDSSNFSRNGTKHEQVDGVGAPKKRVTIDGAMEGSITVQYPNSSSLLVLNIGDLIVIPVGLAPTGSAFTASVSHVTTPRSAGAFWTQEIQADETLNI